MFLTLSLWRPSTVVQAVSPSALRLLKRSLLPRALTATETRNYFSTANLYFNEDFSARVDALRHHDQRRALLKRDLDQPIVMDDFQDPNSSAVRRLYLDPDSPSPSENFNYDVESALDDACDQSASPPKTNLSYSKTSASAPSANSENAADSLHQSLRDVPRGGARETNQDSANGGPLGARAINVERVRNLLREGVVLRPLRLLPVGRPVPSTPDDHAFLDYALQHNLPAAFQQPNPKTKGSASSRKYSRYMRASTLHEALILGAERKDLKWDYDRGFISFPKNEPDIPGHIFAAFELAEQHGVRHALQDARCWVRPSLKSDIVLERAYLSTSAKSFHQQLETIFEPEVIHEKLRDRETMSRFAEEQFAKVMNSSKIEIDFTLSPEPTRYEDAMDSEESADWRRAMDDEMSSMSKFGVYRRVPKSRARGRQILGAKWVYRRKINKLGHVYKHRARLVAQGFLQRPYDSFNPDETYSPVVHKDTLRTFLSLCAASDLHVFQADVKAAFLQAPLRETIFMKAPPGFQSYSANGEEEVLELDNALYGLKQSGACFWEAMRAHLESNGFKSMLGDPCLFRKEFPDGKVILACTYVDDVTYGVSDQATADSFLAMLRSRFVIDEGEGAPIDFLLGMAVHQNLDEGTIRLDMEMAITKLCMSILTKEELVKASLESTPLLVTPLMKNSERTVPKETFDYLSVVGSLLHITNCVRCDVSYAVGVLARHAACPGPTHVRAAKRVLQYLYSTRSLGITYTKSASGYSTPLMYEGATHPLDNGHNRLQVFADSDYAADQSRRSTMGSIVMMNGGPVSWSSVLGKTVAMSTCEAEVNAAVVAAKDALHLKQLLVDLGFYIPKTPLQIGEDNSACIAQAESGLRHVRNAKHYEIRLRFLQELVVDKRVEFVYCPTDLQLADFFTKSLDVTKFQRFRDFIMS